MVTKTSLKLMTLLVGVSLSQGVRAQATATAVQTLTANVESVIANSAAALPAGLDLNLSGLSTQAVNGAMIKEGVDKLVAAKGKLDDEKLAKFTLALGVVSAIGFELPTAVQDGATVIDLSPAGIAKVSAKEIQDATAKVPKGRVALANDQAVKLAAAALALFSGQASNSGTWSAEKQATLDKLVSRLLERSASGESALYAFDGALRDAFSFKTDAEVASKCTDLAKKCM